MQNQITPNLKKLSKLLKKNGDLYIVGGYVRNFFLGIPSYDIDLASKITTTELKQILEGTDYKIKEISRTLGTCIISLGDEKWEHSTFRMEKYPENGSHTPSEVTFITSVKEDARRRDFTINSIYYNINKNSFLDPYNGQEDLKKKIIRCIETPEEVLANDGIRILRMVRIACELSFKIANETMVVAFNNKHNLEDISGERKFAELSLILHAQENASLSRKKANVYGLELMNLLRLWKYFGINAPKIRLKLTKKAPVSLSFYALLIDCINTIKPEYPGDFLEAFLGMQGLCIPTKKIESIKNIIRGYYEALELKNNKKYFLRYFDDFPIILDLLVYKSKSISKKYNFFYNYLINNKIAIRIKDLKISGKDIQQNYPTINETNYKYVLQILLERVFDGFVINEKKQLIEEIKKII